MVSGRAPHTGRVKLIHRDFGIITPDLNATRDFDEKCMGFTQRKD